MKTTTKDNFQQDVIGSSKPVLVDVWAPWCPPCLAMLPVVDQVAQDMGDKIEIIKVDASAEEELTQQLGVSGLPTFFAFKDGKVVDSISGMSSKDALEKMMENLL